MAEIIAFGYVPTLWCWIFGIICPFVIICTIVWKLWVWVDDAQDSDEADAELFSICLIVVPLILSIIVTLFIVAVNFYFITLIIVGTFIVLHLARFTRRLSKKFKVHEKDKDAHK